ncbi:MAG: hypothetical protein ACFFB3_07255 [Candidatus Hodarchaeota archaeon]
MTGEPGKLSEMEFFEQLRYLSVLQASKKGGSKTHFLHTNRQKGVKEDSKK